MNKRKKEIKMDNRKMYVVTYDNDMEGFDRLYHTRENAIEGIKKTIDACRRDWENVSAVYFKDYDASSVITSAIIYLQEEDWEEKIKVNITEMLIAD